MKTHKKYTFSMVLALGLTLQGWTDPPAPPSAETQVAPDTTAKVSVEGAAGAVSVDGKTYFMVAVRPELAFGQIGLGLDLRILWNDDGLRKEDWDELRDVANFIRYIRYGKKSEGVYMRLGVLDDTTLGYGLTVRRYSNMIPTAFDKTFGMDMSLDGGFLGVEGFGNDVATWRLFGGRVFMRPLNGSGIPVFDTTQIGVYAVKDRDPGAAATPLTAYGADIGIPLVKGDAFSATIFAEMSKLEGRGTGYTAPGLTGKILMFDYKFEMRNYAADFIPSLFDWNYEARRPINWSLPQYASTNPRQTGWLGEIGWTWESMLKINGYFEQPTGQNATVHAEVVLLANFIPRVQSASITYDQKDVKTLTLNDPNTLVTAKAGIEMTPGAILYVTVRQTYDPILAKPVRTTTMETRIKL